MDEVEVEKENMMKELLKYLPLLMRYAAYLKFLPLLFDMVAIIREAEKVFSGDQSGAQKLQWASAKFTEIVSALADANVINEKTAAVLIDGAPKVISIIVQFMNAAEGGVLPGDDPVGPIDPPVDPIKPPTSTVPYLKKFPAPVPDDGVLRGPNYQFKPGDQICARSDNDEWMVVKKGASRMGAPLLRPIGGA